MYVFTGWVTNDFDFNEQKFEVMQTKYEITSQHTTASKLFVYYKH